MAALHRALGAFMLICVALALGDAPYVDEFLADLAAQPVQVQLVANVLHKQEAPPAKPSPGSSKICGTLLILSCAPDAVEVPGVESDRSFPTLLTASYSSASPRRIDRPPATTVQA